MYSTPNRDIRANGVKIPEARYLPYWWKLPEKVVY
jgi:hypothetical protein